MTRIAESESIRGLAICGGSPVRAIDRPWPSWPSPSASSKRLLLEALNSGRWAISSPRGSKLFECRFGQLFAEYLGAPFCVPVDHGSSALVVALESLGLEYGDVVLVPALTWTASASAVFRAGLVPQLVDVDPETGCMSPDLLNLERRPRAIIAVHWACSMADVPAIVALADRTGISVIEDCAQAHGARWRGVAAGLLGRIGCFSMQHSKVLTGGEGGAVVTTDEPLAARFEELRADSRRYGERETDGTASRFGLDLVESAEIMGSNFCMSEFSAAVLCSVLPDLDRQHAIRNHNYQYLRSRVEALDGVRVIAPRHEQTQASVYEGTIVFDNLPPAGSIDDVGKALTAELNVHVYPVDEPLNRSRLLRPWTKSTLKPLTEEYLAIHKESNFPNADFLARHAVQIHHSAFLGSTQDMDDIFLAIEKVQRVLGDISSLPAQMRG